MKSTLRDNVSDIAEPVTVLIALPFFLLVEYRGFTTILILANSLLAFIATLLARSVSMNSFMEFVTLTWTIEYVVTVSALIIFVFTDEGID